MTQQKPLSGAVFAIPAHTSENPMIHLILVSHHPDIARGIAALAAQMSAAPDTIHTAAGIDDADNPVGTDAVRIMQAIEDAANPDGILILVDLGSAILSAQTALDLLDDPALAARCRISPAPLVEGAISAAVAASSGADLATVAREAEQALSAKQAALGENSAIPDEANGKNNPLPCEAGEGWGGGVKKPRSNNTHSTVPFTYTTYTSPATLYVKLLLTLALLTAPAFAAPDFKLLETGGSYAQLYQQNVRYGVYQADPARVSLHWKATDGSAYASLGTLKRSLEQSGARVAFLMNAGIYSTDDTPAGLWIERGKTLIPLNRKAGKGNFHIQPNGVFYIEGGKARIQPTAAYQLGQHQPEWALQSGPMLLIDGKPNARFVKNLSSPHKRNAVCTTADGRLYFILTEDYNREGEWPSFHRFAEALQHLGCHDALYLDGTLSGWYIPGIAGTFHWTHYVGIIAVTTPEHP